MIIEPLLLGLFGIVLALAGALAAIVAMVLLIFFRKGVTGEEKK
jgi:hypothetical protein